MEGNAYLFYPRHLGNNNRYVFLSINPITGIKKLKAVEINKIDEPNRFNLGLADFNSEFDLDYNIISDNGDLREVLITVVAIVIDFTNKFPDSILEIKANSPSKLKLYNYIFRNRYIEFEDVFDVFGVKNDENLERYNVNKFYQGFVITKKIFYE